MLELARRRFLNVLSLAAVSAFSPALFATALGWRRVRISASTGSSFSGDALALIPPGFQEEKTNRLVVLLHGYGKTGEPALELWRKEYGVELAHERLTNPPIERLYSTVRYLSDRRIHELDETLAAQTYRGMVLLCPITPSPYLRNDASALLADYADWLADGLIPKARAELPISPAVSDTGLAGVSMGGHVGLEALIRRPQPFGAFVGVLAAVTRKSSWRYAARIAETFESAGARRVCLLTATRDSYCEPNTILHQTLVKKGIAAELQVPFGPHSAAFMKEIGSLEMLLWMDRTLGAVRG